MVHGAQDLSPHESGAYTGDVSGVMLAKLGCRYVVVGHSERRELHGEDDALVNRKVRAAVRTRHRADPVRRRGAAGPRGGRATSSTLHRPAPAALAKVSSEHAQTLVVAYEPVWAIGTGRVASAGGRPGGVRRAPAGPGRRSTARRSPPGMRVLYGGSVKPSNVGEIVAQTRRRRRARRRGQPGRRRVRAAVRDRRGRPAALAVASSTGPVGRRRDPPGRRPSTVSRHGPASADPGGARTAGPPVSWSSRAWE